LVTHREEDVEGLLEPDGPAVVFRGRHGVIGGGGSFRRRAGLLPDGE
jgi:hypothetical protein